MERRKLPANLTNPLLDRAATHHYFGGTVSMKYKHLLGLARDIEEMGIVTFLVSLPIHGSPY